MLLCEQISKKPQYSFPMGVISNLSHLPNKSIEVVANRGEGIRTPETQEGLPVFETGALSLSATPMKAPMGIEPTTHGLRCRRSTTELQGQRNRSKVGGDCQASELGWKHPAHSASLTTEGRLRENTQRWGVARIGYYPLSD